jgi:anti-sigma regulatory factor (Ser/Thr protein kinase)
MVDVMAVSLPIQVVPQILLPEHQSPALEMTINETCGLAALRSRLHDHLKQKGINPLLFDTLIAMVHEVAMNGVVHGGRGTKVRLYFNSLSTLAIYVMDKGKGIATEALSHILSGDQPDLTTECGRGLYMVMVYLQDLRGRALIATSASGTKVCLQIPLQPYEG